MNRAGLDRPIVFQNERQKLACLKVIHQGARKHRATRPKDIKVYAST